MIACTIPAQIWIDRWGRRKPLIIGGSAMAACLLLVGALYARYGVIRNNAVELRSSAGQWVVVVLIYIFTANFSWSWAVVSRLCLPSPLNVVPNPYIRTTLRSAKYTPARLSQPDFVPGFVQSSNSPIGWSTLSLLLQRLCFCAHRPVVLTFFMDLLPSSLWDYAYLYLRLRDEVLRRLRCCLRRQMKFCRRRKGNTERLRKAVVGNRGDDNLRLHRVDRTGVR